MSEQSLESNEQPPVISSETNRVFTATAKIYSERGDQPHADYLESIPMVAEQYDQVITTEETATLPEEIAESVAEMQKQIAKWEAKRKEAWQLIQKGQFDAVPVMYRDDRGEDESVEHFARRNYDFTIDQIGTLKADVMSSLGLAPTYHQFLEANETKG